MTATMTKLAAGAICSLAPIGASYAAAPTYSGEWLLQLEDTSGRARIYAGSRLQIEDTGTTWSLKSWRKSLDKEVPGWNISGSLDGKGCNVDFDAQASNSRIGTLTCKLYREGDTVVLDLMRDVARTTQRFTHTLSGEGAMTVTYQYIEHYGDGRNNTRPKVTEVYRKN